MVDVRTGQWTADRAQLGLSGGRREVNEKILFTRAIT